MRNPEIRKPIIQGPMFRMINGKFVGAVSKAGSAEEEICEARYAYDGIPFIHKVEPVFIIADRLMKGIEEFL